MLLFVESMFWSIIGESGFVVSSVVPSAQALLSLHCRPESWARAPFAFFPFSGWKGSFYGDLHVHGTDGIEFYTRKKMFITRW
jgi:hypothetical protein